MYALVKPRMTKHAYYVADSAEMQDLQQTTSVSHDVIGQFVRPDPPAQRDRVGATADLVDSSEGVYIISVAARMVSMHPQTLRKYERAGLVRPSRTGGMLRLYSDTDILRLRMIKHLVDELGLNVAGVETVLRLVERLGSLHQRVGPGAARSDDMLSALRAEVDAIFSMLQGHAAPPVPSGWIGGPREQ